MGTLPISGALLLATVCLNPTEDVASDDVSLVEVNHCYDKTGRLAFEQLIFYDWSPQHGRFQIRAWRLMRNPSQFPRRNWRQGRYETTWYDQGVLRTVTAQSLRETWTQYDPEMRQRSFLPQERRRELHKPALAGR